MAGFPECRRRPSFRACQPPTISTVTEDERAQRGSVAGASGDAGVEYRRGVAAYAIAHGLAGVPLPGVGVPAAGAQVCAVTLETEDAVDDVRIDFDSGWTAFIQAKRSLKRDKALNKAVAQWVKAGRGSLDPAQDRLVIASATLSGTIRDLQRALARGRLEIAGAPTVSESKILDHIKNLLKDLKDDERERVLKCAVIWELQVEEPDAPDALHAISHLQGLTSSGVAFDSRVAWRSLIDIVGRVARLRGGRDLGGWVSALHAEGIALRTAGSSPAARLEKRHQALARYTSRLIREGSMVDLRSLGAELPAIRLEDIDAGVKVSDNSEDQSGTDLLWSFLRRGRTVLTGLPGAGKSTALRKLAADLAGYQERRLDNVAMGDAGVPFPVRASLRDINALGTTSSFRNRLIAAAIRDDRTEDQAHIREEIERLLDHGSIALLLDSLDETYDHRAKVVGEIDDLFDDLPNGVCALVSTRDVAYGQAATLGWSSLRLREPGDIEKPVTAVLSTAADSKVELESERAAWVQERLRWVQNALKEDMLLRETPLIPVLLALLAAEQAPQNLPTRRPAVLAAIVHEIVARHELKRDDGRTLGPLSGSALDTASMHAFTREAKTILDRNGQASDAEVIDAVASELASQWGLPPGHAATAARDAMRFFDETGVFVLTGAGSVVMPRLALFAEIGDALNAISHADEIATWVRSRVESRQHEPLILACALDPDTAAALSIASHERPGDIALVRALVRAANEGASFDDNAIRWMCERLIEHMATGARNAWQDWERLMSLPMPHDLRTKAESAINHPHHPTRALVARASLDMRFRAHADLIAEPSLLLEILGLSGLDERGSDDLKPAGLFAIGTSVQVLNAVQLSAARALLSDVPEAAERIAERALTAPRQLQAELLQLLDDGGFSTEAETVRAARNSSYRGLGLPSWLIEHDDTVYAHFLELLERSAPHAELTPEQATKLDHLADFLETMDMNDAGVVYFHSEPDGVIKNVIDISVSLYGFNGSVLAAEAGIALERIGDNNDTAPYFSLFGAANEREEADWSAVRNRHDAVKLIVRLFTLGRGQARFAAKSLWESPVSDIAAPLLRALIPEIASSTEHQKYAAHTLVSLRAGPEPENWVNSDDPVLRAVAARTIEPMEGDTLNARMRQLLDDSDGYVQEAALRHIAQLDLPNLSEILAGVASRPNPGWMCLSCRTMNPQSASTSCSKDGCLRVGADPAQTAAELLEVNTLST